MLMKSLASLTSSPLIPLRLSELGPRHPAVGKTGDYFLLCRQLSGVTIKGLKSAHKAVDVLHEKGAKTVVISSIGSSHDSMMVLLASAPWGMQYLPSANIEC